MKLSEYCEKNEEEWEKIERENADKLINYLNNRIDKNLYEVAKTHDNLEVYKNLHLWLFNFYKNELIDGLNYININYEDFEKSIIYSLIISITKESSNVDFLVALFKHINLIDDLIEYEDSKYRLITKSYGDIYFEKANKTFESDKDTMNYVNNCGDKLKGGCHDIAFYLIKKDSNYSAVTSICTKLLNKKYYHSFVLDDNRIIDFTSNLIMSKDDYYLLNKVIELNVLNYSEYLKEKDDSIQFDESSSLFKLLRCALYKQYLNNEVIWKN